MITNYRLSSDKQLTKSDEKGDFIYILEPTKAEIGEMSERFRFPFDYLGGILDDYEKARIERDEHGNNLLLMQYPALSDTGEIETFPCSIVVTADNTVILALNHDMDLTDTESGTFEPEQLRHRLTFRILSDVTRLFDRHLTDFRKQRHGIEKSIKKSTKNDQLLDMIAMQASLIYFEDALKNNLKVLTLLTQRLRSENQDGFAERIYDLQIATDQAHGETQIQLKLMENLRDLFSNIVSNNLNIAMKIMTSATFVLGIPAIIVGFYGMNVPLPNQTHGDMWLLIILGILLICGWVSIWLRRKDMM